MKFHHNLYLFNVIHTYAELKVSSFHNGRVPKFHYFSFPNDGVFSIVTRSKIYLVTVKQRIKGDQWNKGKHLRK